MSTTLTIRLDERTKKRLDQLAAAMDRSKSYLATSAIRDFIEANEWQIREIKKTVRRAERPGAKFIEHEEVSGWLKSWGGEKEEAPPK